MIQIRQRKYLQMIAQMFFTLGQHKPKSHQWLLPGEPDLIFGISQVKSI
jgi:hypothetical protein